MQIKKIIQKVIDCRFTFLCCVSFKELNLKLEATLIQLPWKTTKTLYQLSTLDTQPGPQLKGELKKLKMK